MSHNPFSTRCIRPGAIPYIFPPGESARQLLQLLRQNSWRGEIVGPHGSGKSALLATLIPLVEQAGRKTLLVELHDSQRRLPIDLRSALEPGRAEKGTRFNLCEAPSRPLGQIKPGPFFGPTLVVVDGYEQLGRFSRFRIRWFCRRRGLGLLVTAHAPVGLPLLYRTGMDLQQAERIVAWLLGESKPLVTPTQLADCLRRHGPDRRETLFELYDLYELHSHDPTVQ